MKTFLLLILLSGLCFATIVRVPADYSAIQHAIDSCSSGDTILVSPGKYDEALATNEKSIVLASYYLVTADTNYIDSTIIQGFSDPCITVDGGADSITVIGFTITGGSYKNFGSYRVGAGLFVHQSRLILQNNRVEFNGSSVNLKGKGGALYAYKSEIVVTNNTFAYNRSDYGGAIATDESTVRITGNTFFQNNVQESGGALYLSYSTVFIGNNRFFQNAALGSGGAVNCGSCTGDIIDNDFIENIFVESDSAYGEYGGGIQCSGSIYGILNVINNRFKKNRAGNGAAISCGNNVLLQNNLITENKEGLGSAIYVNGNTKIVNNTIYNNDGYAAVYIKSGSPQIINNIIWANTLRNEWKSIYIKPDPGTPVIAYCNIQDGFDGTGNITADPLFRNAAAGDLHLQSTDCGYSANSPCIDSGSPSYKDTLLSCDAGLGAKLSDMGAYGGGVDLTTGITDKQKRLPQKYLLINISPNPFNSTTKITVRVDKPQEVIVSVFDITGKRVCTLYRGFVGYEGKSMLWRGTDDEGRSVASGSYVISLSGPGASLAKRVLLIK